MHQQNNLRDRQSLTPASHDIAVTGLSCSFADAPCKDLFWQNLLQGKSAVKPYPRTRLRDSAYRGVDGPAVEGGYLDDVSGFDAALFHLSPREALLMEPAQRILLETVYETISDAGYTPKQLRGSKTGVFIGTDSTFRTDYYYLLRENDILATTGTLTSILSGRINYQFHFTGPNMVIDTACSSGLVALHHACQSIRRGECDTAFAGGIHLILSPAAQTQLNEIEADGEGMRPFDRDTAGTVWGEGTGILMLKPLSDALRDKDHVYAVIKGSAVGSDGASNGLTAPNARAQTTVLLDAWKDAGIDPADLSHIETHGTGTRLGDSIELRGLSDAMKRYTKKKQFCTIASVKAMVGHTAGASGIASVIKTVLAMNEQILPPSRYFKAPIAGMRLTESPFYLNDRAIPWTENGRPRLAGVSSFGFSGMNCHVVLEQAPSPSRTGGMQAQGGILALSARSPQSLAAVLEAYRDRVSLLEDGDLPDLCYTANCGREHYFCRAAFVFHSSGELYSQLSQCLKAMIGGQTESTAAFCRFSREREMSAVSDDTGKLMGAIGRYRSSGGQDTAQLHAISDAYLNGHSIPWDTLYQGQPVHRISLPCCPMEHVRYWPDQTGGGLPLDRLPLLDRCKEETDGEVCFTTHLCPDKHWVLSDHKVLSRYVLPGTAYLEIIREAVSYLGYPIGIIMHNVSFLVPMAVGEGRTAEVSTVLSRTGEGFRFHVSSQIDGGEPVPHVMGEVTVAKEGTTGVPTSGCPEGFSDFVQTDLRVGDHFTFGPRWWCQVSVRTGEGQLSAEIRLDERFYPDTAVYDLHPSLVDIMVNLMNPNTEQEMFLPLSYQNIRIYGPMPPEVRCEITQTLSRPDLRGYQIKAYTTQGDMVMEVTDYLVKRVEPQTLFLPGNISRMNLPAICWVPVSLQQPGQIAFSGTVLLFCGASRQAGQAAEILRKSGQAYLIVFLGEQYRKQSDREFVIRNTEGDYVRLMSEIDLVSVSHIVHILTEDGNMTAPETLGTSLELGVYSLFYLVRALVHHQTAKQVIFAPISFHAADKGTGLETVLPHNAAFLAMARVVCAEIPQFLLCAADINSDTPAELLLSHIAAADNDSETMFRGTQTYCKEWMNAVQPMPRGIDSAPSYLKRDGVYVITGGCGGIGTALARRMISGQRIKVALISRNPGAFDLAGQNLYGSVVQTYAADVADLDAMRRTLARIRTELGEIRGVIHGAGVAGDGLLFLKEKQDVEKVIAPKIYGVWNLDHLTRDDPLDFFVLFSSIASFLNEQGQADYSAANEYLNQYSRYRSREHSRTLSINWPSWCETGMAVEHGKDFTGDIMVPLQTEDALDFFEQAVLSGEEIVIAGQPVPEQFNVWLKDSSFYTPDVRRQMPALSQDQPEVIESGHMIRLSGRESEHYTETEQMLAGLWRNVLGSSFFDIGDSFYTLGGSSIQMIQIFKVLSEQYPGKVDIADLFAHPTIESLGKVLDKRL